MTPERKALLEHLEWLKVEQRNAHRAYRAAEVKRELTNPKNDLRHHWQGQSKALQKAITDLKWRLTNAGIDHPAT